MLKRRRKRLAPSSSSSDSAQMMNLSLFIMLLAFFIVLNGLSSFDEVRVEPVVDSIKSSFSTDIHQEDVKPSVKEDPIQSVHEGETIERLDALFQAQIVGYKATKSPARGMIQIDVPLDEFSTAVMAMGQEDLTLNRAAPEDGAFFLPTLVSILKSDVKGLTYRMDMMYHLPDNPAILQNESPKQLVALSQRAGQITRRLEEAGMSQRLMNYGVQKGDEKVVTLVFSPHYPFDPGYGQEEDLE